MRANRWILLPSLPRSGPRHDLSTGTAKALRANGNLGICLHMGDSRIASALTRIEAAMERITKVRPPASQPSSDTGGSANVTALVNAHEKLREEVAETMREIDGLIEELEA